MALSDLNEKPATWSTDPLLNSKVQTPHFLRTQWDEASARSFGPWRVAPKSDPAEGLMSAAPAKGDLSDLADGTGQEPTALAETPEPVSPWSDAALAQLRQEAFDQGLLEGQAQARAEVESERSKESEMLRHLGIELRSISQDPQRFFEPLKRLALHLAEQLVRAELQLSGQAVHNLVQACIGQLDHPAEPVTVSLNPQDLQRLKAMGDSVTHNMLLEPDAQLRPGSVRVRAQDSVVQDLIDNRLEPLARRLLAQPEAFMQQSTLLKDKAEALPEDTPSRDWSRQVIDIEDIEDIENVEDSKTKPAAPSRDDLSDDTP